MSNITIGSSEIRCIDGLYSLNDLHVASGNEQRHQPRYFLANKQTVDLIEEIENSGNSLFKPIKVLQGRNGGTYACKELVIAYAAWISPAFHLKVIMTFLERTGRVGSYQRTINYEQVQKIKSMASASYIRMLGDSAIKWIYNHLRVKFGVDKIEDIPADKFNEVVALLEEKMNDARQFIEMRYELTRLFCRDILGGGTSWTPAIKRKLTQKMNQKAVIQGVIDWKSLN